MQNSLLLILDPQNGVLEKPVYEKAGTLGHINSVIEVFGKKGLPIIMTRHTNKSFLVSGTNPWQISPDICQPAGVILLDKGRSNIFAEPAFVKLLTDNGIRTLFICGFASNGCVQAACTEALKHGLDVVVLRDAHSTFVKNAGETIELWNTKMADMGAKVMDAEAAVRLLDNDGSI